MTTKKTLNEMVNEIIKSKSSAAKKRMALIKLGVTPYEAMYLATLRKPEQAAEFAYTFGVEIECYKCRFSDFRRVGEENGIRIFDDFGYTHRNMPIYKLVTDSSLSGTNTAECVTPPLNGNEDGFSSLKSCCKTLNQIGADVNMSCGLHVHIGAKDLTDQEYCNVFVNYMYLESAINSFLAPSRSASRWCETLTDHKTRILRSTRKDEMRYSMNGRYHKVNPESYSRHQTIEFRQHQGTINYTKISRWVKFLAKLVEYSKTNRLSQAVSRIEDIPFLNEDEKQYFIGRRAWFEAHRG